MREREKKRHLTLNAERKLTRVRQRVCGGWLLFCIEMDDYFQSIYHCFV